MADQVPAATDRRPATPRWVKLLGVATIALIVVVGGVMFLAGGNHGPGMHVPGGSQASPTFGAANGPGVGGPTDADDATRTVEIAMRDAMRFEPGAINVSGGEVIKFVVTNTGQTAHEFTLGDAAMQQEHADAMAHMPDGMIHDLPNSITLQAGESKELTWRFGDPGVLEYGCHKPGHYEAGMRGQISVS